MPNKKLKHCMKDVALNPERSGGICLLPKPVITQILPFWIHWVDKFNFFPTTPIFQLLLPGNCSIYISCSFKINKAVDLVFPGKLRTSPIFMCPNPPLEIVRHPDVECTWVIHHYINKVLMHDLQLTDSSTAYWIWLNYFTIGKYIKVKSSTSVGMT